MKFGRFRVLTNVILWIAITLSIFSVLILLKQLNSVNTAKANAATANATLPGAAERINDYWYGGQFIPGYSVPAGETPAASL